MPKTTFSDLALKNLQPPPKGQIDFWDDKLPAFGLRVSQGGSKTFVLRRNNTRLVIGRYGVLTLAEARAEARRMLAEFTLGKVRPQSITYTQAVKLFIEEKKKQRRVKTYDGYEWLLGRLSFNCQLADVTHSDIARGLDKIKSRSTYNHALVALKIFFNWTIKRRYVTENPTMGLSPHATQARSRVLSDQELKLIWKACERCKSRDGGHVELSDEASGSPPPANYCTIVKLMILTGQRRGEIAALQTLWIDQEEQTITLPASVTKNGKEHRFPIASSAWKLLSERASCPSRGNLLFPARGKATPFNGWQKAKVALDQLSGAKDWTLHDLRRTFRSAMGRLGVAPHIAERLVNHISSRTDMEVVYDRWTYMPEMRAAVEKYDAHLSEVFNA